MARPKRELTEEVQKIQILLKKAKRRIFVPLECMDYIEKVQVELADGR
jgi:hypothetical protein